MGFCGKNLGHWGHIFKGDTEVPAPPLSSLSLPGCHILCHILPPWCTASPQVKKQKAKWPGAGGRKEKGVIVYGVQSFSFARKMRILWWRMVLWQYECAQGHRAVYLKMMMMAHFMFHMNIHILCFIIILIIFKFYICISSVKIFVDELTFRHMKKKL